jgi:PAS domain S-box-containing protein
MSSKAGLNLPPNIVRYGIAVLGVAAATIVRMLLTPVLGARLPFTTYFVVAITVAIFLGIGPSLLTIALGGILGTVLFIVPARLSGNSGLIQLLPYFVVSVGLSFLIKVIQDARRRAEQAAIDLVESRERLATILASIADAVIATDLEGRVTFMNGVAQKLTGFSEQDAAGKQISELFTIIDPDSREPIDDPVSRVLHDELTNGPATQSLLIAKNGSETPIEDNSTSIKAGNGKATGVVLVFRDITQRKQVEQELREKERHFRTMADTTPVMLWLSGADGLYNFFNQSWLDFTGRTMEQEIGYGWAENVHPDDLRRCLDSYMAALEKREAFTIEYQLRRSDGKYRWALCNGVPRYTKEGEFVGFAGSCVDIAERKSAEEAAHSLASIVESSEDAIIGKTLEGLIVSWNAAAERIYGYSADEITGKHIGILATGDQGNELANIFETLKRGEAIPHLETVRKTKDDRVIDVALTISPIHDEAGHVTGASTIARDITNRKKQEQERAQLALLVENERQRLDNVVANVPGVVWESWGKPDQAEQRIDFVSDYVEKMLGYSTEEWLSKPNFWLSIVHPDDVQRATEEAAAIYAGGKGGTSRFRWIAKDGRDVWVEAQSVVVCDDSETPIGMRGVTMDITERKRTEDAQRFLAEASGLLANSLDYETTLGSVAKLAVPNLADWCVVHTIGDNDRVHQIAVVHSDPAKEDAARLLQQRYPVDPGASIGVPNVLRTGRAEFYPVVNPQRLALVGRHKEVARALAELGLKSCMIVPLVARNRTLGTITLATAESNRYYDSYDLALAEDVAHRIALAVDNARLYREAQQAVTAREEALRVRDDLLNREHAAREEAESANRAKDEFLATVSHELRTPLNAILGWAHMLRTNRLDNVTQGRALETIERNAKSQAQLIEDILDVSRIVAGKLNLEVRPIELANVVDAAIDAVRPAADAKGIKLEVVLDPRAGPVLGDPNRLQQVIWNLAANAVKFTGKGGTVQVRLQRAGSYVEIVVSDTGQGIHNDFLPYVFERFRQADATSTRSHGGLGLGLAIVRHLVEMHGGAVFADSPGAGKGSTFTVRLPLLTAHRDRRNADTSDASTPANVLPGPSTRLEGVNVMIVDDESDTREMLRLLMRQLGAEVRACASSDEAMSVLNEWNPDVIVSDIEMPDEDGYELIRKVRRLEANNGSRKVPAVALTAYGRVEDRVRALSAGYQIHIAKPAEPNELALVIAGLASKRASRLGG